MSIYDLTIEELTDYFINNNSKKYYALELFSWLYDKDKRITSFDMATNLSKEIREKLKNDFTISNIEIVTVEKAKDVKKYLFRLNDREHIEAVLMNHDYGNSLCVSSQVGCNMGCKFCESGRRKKVRNLTAGEMVEQILLVEKEANLRISHVVIMGIGEPFDNYDNVCKFIKIINHPKGINIGARHITVSTCGIVPKILEFSDFPYQVNLAISLHAANDDVRKEIMPIAKVYPIDELIKTIKIYLERTNRRVTFEYIMLDGINDRESDALELVHLLKGINCYINLIPYNETDALQYKRSKPLTIAKFYDILKKNNITVTIRKEFGGTVSAACGQLRSKKEDI